MRLLTCPPDSLLVKGYSIRERIQSVLIPITWPLLSKDWWQKVFQLERPGRVCPALTRQTVSAKPVAGRRMCLSIADKSSSLRLSLSISQCGGCFSTYDTPAGTQVVYE